MHNQIYKVYKIYVNKDRILVHNYQYNFRS